MGRRSLRALFAVATLLSGVATSLATNPAGAAPIPVASSTARRDPTAEAQALDRITEIEPRAAPLFAEATRRLDAGDGPGAVTKFDEVLALTGPQPDALRRKAWALLLLNDAASAARATGQAVALDPSAVNLAADATARFLQFSPGSMPTADDLAGLRTRLVEADTATDADADTKRQIASIGAEAESRYGDPSKALVWIRRLVAASPADPSVHLMAARAHLLRREQSEGDAEISTARRLGATDELVGSFGLSPRTSSAPRSMFAALGQRSRAVGVLLLATFGAAIAVFSVRKRSRFARPLRVNVTS